ncbi:MAG: TIM44-like domain-containing protein [Pseudomonadota bacterium]
MYRKRLQSVVQLMLAASFLTSSLIATVEAARPCSSCYPGINRNRPRPTLRSANEVQSERRSVPEASSASSNRSTASDSTITNSSTSSTSSISIQQQPPAATPQTQMSSAYRPSQYAAAEPAKRSWLAPLAGVAAGLGLSKLFGGSANAGSSTGIYWLLLIVLGIALLWWFLRRRRSLQADQYDTQAPAYAAQPANIDSSTSLKEGWAADHESKDAFVNKKHTVSFASDPSFNTTANPKDKVLPDQNAFLHAARQYFLSLQAAFDKGDLEPFHDWMVPELRDDLIAQIKERNQAVNKTEILTLSADVLEEKADTDANWVTVRFNGTTREGSDPTPQAFNEAWHFKQCRRTSNDPWKLAGIDPLSDE